MENVFDGILDGARAGRALDAAGAARLVGLFATGLADLMAAARLAASAGGRKGFACAIVNAKSGACGEDCAFCAQSARYGANAPLKPLIGTDVLLARAEAAAARNIDYLGIVTSGGTLAEADFDRLCEDAARIAGEVGVGLCASFGLLDPERAIRLKQAGFSSCHHNLETSERHYPAVCTTHSHRDRVETVRTASAAGLRVCSGVLFGIGESWEDRVDLSRQLAELEVDSIPVNFLMPIPGTPYADAAPPAAEETLAALAMLRLMHPGRDLIMAAGRSTSLGEFAALAVAAGVNGLMVGDFLTREGGSIESDLRLLKIMGMKE